jgi:hypothetical protein
MLAAAPGFVLGMRLAAGSAKSRTHSDSSRFGLSAIGLPQQPRRLGDVGGVAAGDYRRRGGAAGEVFGAAVLTLTPCEQSALN